jgi:hypothetical protein
VGSVERYADDVLAGRIDPFGERDGVGPPDVARDNSRAFLGIPPHQLVAYPATSGHQDDVVLQIPVMRDIALCSTVVCRRSAIG